MDQIREREEAQVASLASRHPKRLHVVRTSGHHNLLFKTRRVTTGITSSRLPHNRNRNRWERTIYRSRTMIVELQKGCWLTDGEGDPPRTMVEASAKEFQSMKEALAALAEARIYLDVLILVKPKLLQFLQAQRLTKRKLKQLALLW